MRVSVCGDTSSTTHRWSQLTMPRRLTVPGRLTGARWGRHGRCRRVARNARRVSRTEGCRRATSTSTGRRTDSSRGGLRRRRQQRSQRSAPRPRRQRLHDADAGDGGHPLGQERACGAAGAGEPASRPLCGNGRLGGRGDGGADQHARGATTARVEHDGGGSAARRRADWRGGDVRAGGRAGRMDRGRDAPRGGVRGDPSRRAGSRRP